MRSLVEPFTLLVIGVGSLTFMKVHRHPKRIAPPTRERLPSEVPAPLRFRTLQFLLSPEITEVEISTRNRLFACILCNQFVMHLVLPTEATYRPFFNT